MKLQGEGALVRAPTPTTNLLVKYFAGRSRETDGRIARVLGKCSMKE